MFRRLSFALLSVCLIAGLLCGCTDNTAKPSPGGSAEPAGSISPSPELKEYDLGGLAMDICGTNAFSDILDTVSAEVAAGLYGIEPGDVEESRLMCSTGATAEEIGLFKCTDEEAAARVEAKANDRIKLQKKAYESYAPEEIPKLDDAVITKKGAYVFYVVSTDSSKIKKVIK